MLVDYSATGTDAVKRLGFFLDRRTDATPDIQIPVFVILFLVDSLDLLPCHGRPDYFHAFPLPDVLAIRILTGCSVSVLTGFIWLLADRTNLFNDRG